MTVCSCPEGKRAEDSQAREDTEDEKRRESREPSTERHSERTTRKSLRHVRCPKKSKRCFVEEPSYPTDKQTTSKQHRLPPLSQYILLSHGGEKTQLQQREPLDTGSRLVGKQTAVEKAGWKDEKQDTKNRTRSWSRRLHTADEAFRTTLHPRIQSLARPA